MLMVIQLTFDHWEIIKYMTIVNKLTCEHGNLFIMWLWLIGFHGKSINQKAAKLCYQTCFNSKTNTKVCQVLINQCSWQLSYYSIKNKILGLHRSCQVSLTYRQQKCYKTLINDPRELGLTRGTWRAWTLDIGQGRPLLLMVDQRGSSCEASVTRWIYLACWPPFLIILSSPAPPDDHNTHSIYGFI